MRMTPLRMMSTQPPAYRHHTPVRRPPGARLDAHRYIACLALALLLGACARTTKATDAPVSNLATDRHGFQLHAAGGAGARFDMRFCVLYREDAPDLAMRPGEAPVLYNVPTWKAPAGDKPAIGTRPSDSTQVGDGFDPRILQGKGEARTADAFAAAPMVCMEPEQVRRDADRSEWTFPAQPGFEFSSSLEADPDPALPPRLHYRLVAHRPGYYSVAYVGAPAHAPANLDELWQPLVWTEKRFPDRSYLTPAFLAPLPTALLSRNGQTEGVVVDPKEFPFDPLPVLDNSRFGVALRTAEGQARPMVFAPVLGGAGSKLAASQAFEFTLRPLVRGGGIAETRESVARGLYGFSDYRHNAISSINATLERIIDYGMGEWAQFREQDKGSSYETDAPGTVKNVSSLNPLDMALVTDDAAIWQHRVEPYIEYMLSREKYLFSLDEKQKIQSPSYTLKGPVAPVSELTALHRIFNGATPAFLTLAREEYASQRVRNLDVAERGDSWQNSLALYRATDDRADLERAMAGADDYLRQRLPPQTGFVGNRGEKPFFWTQFVPDFAALVELYEASGERRYLDAAHTAARDFTAFVWMSPAVPDHDVRVNPDGKAPVYWYLAGKGHRPMLAPAEDVPAWRLSEIGLTPESSGTSSGHRAIFMANWAPWLLRIGHYSDDRFLQEIAHSAVLGRYSNFPGYHINTARTTIYEKPDYPLRDTKELSVNSFHFNHIWPMASMLMDYLVSEAQVRSDDRIRFPAEFIEAYAYLQNRAYGGKVGRFYERDDAVLWMPKELLKPDSVEVNYIAARSLDNDRLYLALMNASKEPVTTRVQLDRKYLPGLAAQAFAQEVRTDGKGAAPIAIDNGVFATTIPPRGLVTLTLAGASIQPGLQARVMANRPQHAWSRGYARMTTPAARSMILRLGSGLQHAYVYLEDSKRDYRRVDLHYRIDQGPEQVLRDASFPWEFSVPLDDNVRRFRWRLEAVSPAGAKQTTEQIELRR